MRPGILTALAAVGLAVAAPVALAGQQSTTIGNGKGANQVQPAPSCFPNCQGANLRRANLYRANLTNANLFRAFLTRANLTRANLRDAGLTRANLAGANITRANLRGAKWANTTCPNGTVTSTGC
jgi:uncharacterized protein YjbI with pentapeptide repeats